MGVAEGIWRHGRWRRLRRPGRPRGKAGLADRNVPTPPYARTVRLLRELAAEHGAVAMFGKVIAEPVVPTGESRRPGLAGRRAANEGLAETAGVIGARCGLLRRLSMR